MIGLSVNDCDLPRPGSGALLLRETRPRSGSAWTDSGTAHDRRGLKNRPQKTVRTVPIPPDLVALLRWHLVAYGAAPDGRLLRTQRGGLIQDTGYGEVWAEARARALTPVQRRTALAKRPYDVRHAAVSTWLSSGVEYQVVARRAGHSVAVLLRVYAKCLDGAAATANARIEATLRGGRSPPNVRGARPTQAGQGWDSGETTWEAGADRHTPQSHSHTRRNPVRPALKQVGRGFPSCGGARVRTWVG